MKQKFEKLIRTYKVSSEIAKKLLDENDSLGTLIYDDISKDSYKYGLKSKSKTIDGIHSDRNFVVFDKNCGENGAFVCTFESFIHVSKEIALSDAYWKSARFVIKNDEEVDDGIEEEITGWNAYRKMKSVIRKQYSENEYDSILKSLKPKDGLREWHWDFFKLKLLSEPCLTLNMGDEFEEFYESMYEFKNCYYYDLNSAYLSELCKIFPKCSESFNQLYMDRKKDPTLKKVFNYYVGYLKKTRVYADARAYIVNRIRYRMMEFLKENESKITNILYINTDGCILQCSEKLREGSSNLGDFKIEAEGTCKMVCQSNYKWLFKLNDIVKGNLQKNTRDTVNWDEGIVPVVKITRDKKYGFKNCDILGFRKLNLIKVKEKNISVAKLNDIEKTKLY